MLIKPKPGARLDTNARYTVDELVNRNYDFGEQPESMRFHHHEELLSHCKDKDPAMPQQDDGVSNMGNPMPDSGTARKQGGPTSRRHRT